MEAGIKSVKRHLKRIIGKTLLAYENMQTLLLQIEAVLNYRPPFPLSTDPNDLVLICVGHFLIGITFYTFPGVNLSHHP